jgi:hypothetical protein
MPQLLDLLFLPISDRSRVATPMSPRLGAAGRQGQRRLTREFRDKEFLLRQLRVQVARAEPAPNPAPGLPAIGLAPPPARLGARAAGHAPTPAGDAGPETTRGKVTKMFGTVDFSRRADTMSQW